MSNFLAILLVSSRKRNMQMAALIPVQSCPFYSLWKWYKQCKPKPPAFTRERSRLTQVC